MRLLDEIVGDQIAPRAVQARVLAGFASVAVLLATVGLYGLLAFAVSRRTREIGLRMALGATPWAMIGLVVRRGLIRPALVWPSAAAPPMRRGARWNRCWPASARTIRFSAAMALTVALTLVGTLLPAIRAARISPLEAARE